VNLFVFIFTQGQFMKILELFCTLDLKKSPITIQSTVFQARTFFTVNNVVKYFENVHMPKFKIRMNRFLVIKTFLPIR